MTILRHKTPLLLSVLLMTAVAATPVTVQADPLGQLVNMIMNKVLDNAEKKEKPVQQQNRSISIPEKSLVGTLSPPNGNQLKIDGDNYQLAFNSRIRDEGNRIVQTGMIHKPKRVRYTLNSQEQVDKIWFLKPGEK